MCLIFYGTSPRKENMHSAPLCSESSPQESVGMTYGQQHMYSDGSGIEECFSCTVQCRITLSGESE